MSGAGIGGYQRAYRGQTDEWLTPPWIIRELGPFDLDPCGPINGAPWTIAAAAYTERDNGLHLPWHGFVWLNPPYGPHTGQWLARLAEHGSGIALIFARTETVTWHDFVWKSASCIKFPLGRIYFHRATGERSLHNSGAPSAFVGYGEEATRRILGSNIPGALVTGWQL